MLGEAEETETGDGQAQAREALEHPEGGEDLRRLDGVGPVGARGGVAAGFVFHASDDAPPRLPGAVTQVTFRRFVETIAPSFRSITDSRRSPPAPPLLAGGSLGFFAGWF